MYYCSIITKEQSCLTSAGSEVDPSSPWDVDPRRLPLGPTSSSSSYRMTQSLFCGDATSGVSFFVDMKSASPAAAAAAASAKAFSSLGG